MARGGYRPGAGRPKGPAAPNEQKSKAPAKPKARAKKAEPLEDVKRAARKAGLSPLAYMLDVMNDDLAEVARRDRMAIASAPFVHGRAADVAKPGVKEQANAAAVTAARGTDWDNLLAAEAAPLQ